MTARMQFSECDELPSNISPNAHSPEGKFLIAMIERAFLDISFNLRHIGRHAIEMLHELDGDLDAFLDCVVEENVYTRDLETVAHFVRSDDIDGDCVTLAYCCLHLAEEPTGFLEAMRKGFRQECRTLPLEYRRYAPCKIRRLEVNRKERLPKATCLSARPSMALLRSP